MATDLAVTGQTSISWSLSDAADPISYSATAQKRTSRSIANGSSAGQANVAWSGKVSVTGTSTTTINIINELKVNPYNTYGYVFFQSLRELMVDVISGPTGGYVVLSITGASPTAPANIPIGVGGQLHFVDYHSGLTLNGADSMTIKAGATGSYFLDVTAIGVGQYANDF